MKKIMCCIVCCYLFMGHVQADSYIVMSDADNTILEAKNENETQSVASISKIMTALIALEKGSLHDQWIVSDEIRNAYGSCVYLQVGQQVTLEDLLYALMLRSGNDAAVEIAKQISGSQEHFVNLMNEKANQLGMINTVFSNPTGLDENDQGNVSSAKDMALLMSHAMKNKQFRKITSAQYYTTAWNTRWKNKNKLVFDFPFTIGGKTGYTKKAGRTLVSVANYNGVESIVVTLKTMNDFAFHKEKHTETLATIEVVPIVKKGFHIVNQRRFHVPSDIFITVKKDGSDDIRINTHFDQKDFVIEVMKNKELTIYSFSSTSTSTNPIKRWFS